MATPLKLYSTSSCHLCEDAITILLTLPSHDFTWDEVEISDSDALLTRYGTRIPVLLNCHSGRELNWPFTEKDVIQLITENRA